MKKGILFFICMLGSVLVFAQVKNPVKWEFSTKKINETTYELHLTAKIDDGWHLYSQTTPKGGAYPTVISFSKNPLVTKQGSPKEIGELESIFEPLFMAEVKQYEKKVDFVQTVNIKSGVKTKVTGNVTFMACNDKLCTAPTKQSFTFELK